MMTDNDRTVGFTPIDPVKLPPEPPRDRRTFELAWDSDGRRLELERGTAETEARKAAIARELAASRPVTRGELEAERALREEGVNIATNTKPCEVGHSVSLYIGWDGVRRCRFCRDAQARAELDDALASGKAEVHFG